MQTKDNVTIVIADDHPLMRKGLRDLIEEKSRWQVVGEASDGEEALALVRSLHPTVLVIDIDMPKLNGLEVIRIIQQEHASVKTVVLTMYDKETIFDRAMESGVLGYVMKDAVVTEIVDCIENVLASKYYISPSLSSHLVRKAHLSQGLANQIAGLSTLTPMERKILKMISRNLTTRDIANELFISTRTVETHRANICQKLNLHGPTALLRFALENKDAL
jgi:DNA-binding NarL/FixJ family response regulator